MYGRNPGSTSSGRSFDAATVAAVWAKARAVPGYNANEIRKDSCNAWIRRSDYGQTTAYGWEIDHIRPVAKYGSDEFLNLQPLHWQNNRHKGDSYPNWTCLISAKAA
jgi:hypothetical protein